MSEHTPGPWFVIEDPADRELWIRARDAEWLARVWGQRPEANSNANLIAAAPELLEVVRELALRYHNNYDPGSRARDIAALLPMAYDAIAKAEGRQQ